jgi:hypothetical protein
VGEVDVGNKLQGESKRGPKSFKGILRPVEANNCVIRENKVECHSEYFVVNKPQTGSAI